ncbi:MULTISPECIES: LysR family transcriptional regulator [Kandleria]|jgi:DNA-binding transcriptional LysR family regulator|uniref:LysR family transcriptional regulator n=1 Tax=Kandleria TaxID=1279388 RepID=UPI00089153CB|nr:MULTISPECIES: LysR family transcriptional regulator [Kandleria]MBP3276363.1 LysR family transcriptional regulator [Kandleria sp.]MEE0988925.1 LysR family transcriptional regulator [Kandleria vitulina]SDL55800.1 DNA-binding transcriptional regulator, LysR family [Kandleria vitulina]SEJ31376.1 DNA-binding transcriptional regulator, LysR family [Kandleria vitulina]
MTLQQLKYVLQVAKDGSINEAAKNLFISQPSLSNAIKDIEEELELSLFHRTNKGITVTNDGEAFLGYARAVVEQYALLEERYLDKKNTQISFSVSTQHYSFAINAFVELLEEVGYDTYSFSIEETKTNEIIENVKNMKSEVGILYMNDFNHDVISKILHESKLVFHSLFVAKPHVFMSMKHPLAHRKSVKLEELDDYPYLSYLQGETNSFYFMEEIQSTYPHTKSIKVSDRGTLFNLMIGLQGYTISTGIVFNELNPEITAIPLEIDDYIEVGYILHKKSFVTPLAQKYLDLLKKSCQKVLD